MRILLCPDSFKESLGAWHVAQALAQGFRRALPQAHCHLLPLADGGEGTVEALVAATGGRVVRVPAHDPLMRPREAEFGLLGDGVTAAIELAAASGLALLPPEERNPLVTSTFGLGELMKAALDAGCRRLVVGIGGSATNDGGAGLATALGARLLDADGQLLPPGGAALARLAHADLRGLDPRLALTEILVACDVTNPLTGPQGASAVYGPQKGADPGMVEVLDAALAHYATVLAKQLGRAVAQVPGAGAAGGTGAGLMAFLGAQLRPGFALVADAVGLAAQIAQADWVVTGEGKIDEQTRFGKVPFGVAQLAAVYQKPVLAFAGTIGAGAEVMYQHGLLGIFPIVDRPMPLTQALAQAPALLERAAERVGRLLAFYQPG
ncbi:MAG: glycerate kinase [Bernardetiaceae bacterium]|nr:glycerate kinase [Bernardetiaceae bacterium]